MKAVDLYTVSLLYFNMLNNTMFDSLYKNTAVGVLTMCFNSFIRIYHSSDLLCYRLHFIYGNIFNIICVQFLVTSSEIYHLNALYWLLSSTLTLKY